jgi:hypothetical protein
MLGTQLRTLGAALALGAFALPAATQLPDTDPDNPEARILEIDRQSREITVWLEELRTTETFSVAEDAEFYWYDGIMNRPEEFSDLSNGDTVRLEFEDIKGARGAAQGYPSGKAAGLITFFTVERASAPERTVPLRALAVRAAVLPIM